MKRLPMIAAIAIVLAGCAYGAVRFYIASHDADALYELAGHCHAGCYIWMTPDGALRWVQGRLRPAPAQEAAPKPLLMRF